MLVLQIIAGIVIGLGLVISGIIVYDKYETAISDAKCWKDNAKRWEKTSDEWRERYNKVMERPA